MPVPGFRTNDDFLAAFETELEERSVHQSRPGLRPGQRGKKPKPSRPPDVKPLISGLEQGEEFRLKGAPGSSERIEQVRALAPETFTEIEREQRKQVLAMLLTNWAYSEREDLDADVQREAARLVWEIEDDNVYRIARETIVQQSGDAGLFDSLLANRLQIADRERYEQDAQGESSRLGKFQGELEQQYDIIERKLGTAGLEAADLVAQDLAEKGFLYDPTLDPEQINLLLRGAAEAGRAEAKARNVANVHAALGEEIKRRHGPAGNDEQRAEWEAKVDESTQEAFWRAQEEAGAYRAGARALAAREQEREGKSRFESALDAELEKMSLHDSTSEHRQAIRKAGAAEYERTHQDGAPLRDERL
jgi:hypothetical protein